MKPGYSRATVQANIMALMREGLPQNQAVAAALRAGRDSFFARHPQGFPPWHLRTRDEKARTGTRQNPIKPALSLWRYDTTTGLWRFAREVTPDTADAWLKIFSEDDTKNFYKVSKNKPSTDPRKLRRNPISPTAANSARSLAARFHGRQPDDDEYQTVAKPKIPDAMACIGEIFAIEYVAERDGKEYRFRHVFKVRSRPQLAVSPDGKTVALLGGAWHFGTDGFEDH